MHESITVLSLPLIFFDISILFFFHNTHFDYTESNPVTNDGGAKSNGVHDLDNEQDSIKKGDTGLDWSECNSNTEAEPPPAGAGVLPFVNLPILGRVSNVSGITNHFDDNDTNATETDANDAETEGT